MRHKSDIMSTDVFLCHWSKENVKFISVLSEDDKLVSQLKCSEEQRVDESPEVWSKNYSSWQIQMCQQEKKLINTTLWLETGGFITEKD